MPTEVTKLPFAMFQPETAMEAMQRGFSCYSGAVAQMAQCLMTAAAAEVELMRSVYTGPVTEGERSFLHLDPREAVRDWLLTGQKRYDSLMKTHRQINDNLTAGLFAATHGLVDGVGYPRPEESPIPRVQPKSQVPTPRTTGPTQQAAE